MLFTNSFRIFNMRASMEFLAIVTLTTILTFLCIKWQNFRSFFPQILPNLLNEWLTAQSNKLTNCPHMWMLYPEEMEGVAFAQLSPEEFISQELQFSKSAPSGRMRDLKFTQNWAVGINHKELIFCLILKSTFFLLFQFNV